MKNTTFTPLNDSSYNRALEIAKKHGKRFDRSVQELALTAIYNAMMDGDSRKADQIHNILRGSDKKLFENFVTAFSNLQLIDKDYKDTYKLRTGKNISEDRIFFAVPLGLNAEKKTFETIEACKDILWSAFKPEKKKTVKPIETMKALASLLKRKESDSWAFESQDEIDSFNALSTYVGVIEEGLTLQALKDFLRDEIRVELEIERGEKSREIFQHDAQLSLAS